MQNNEKKSEVPNDLFPIVLHEGVHVVDSRLIAEALGIAHKNFLENIKKHQNKTETNFGTLAFETREFKTTQGNVAKERYAFLNEGQALFLATLSKNTNLVVDFKTKLVISFLEARQKLQEAKTLLEEIETAFDLEEYVDIHFEKLFDMVNQLIYKNNIHSSDIADNYHKITEIRGKITFLEEAVKFLRNKLSLHETLITKQHDRITCLEKIVTEVQINQKNAWQRFEEYEKYQERVKKRLGIEAACFVYVFFCPNMKMYKIGWADDTDARQNNLRNANPHIEFVMAIPTRSRQEVINLEKMLHHLFGYCRHKKRNGSHFQELICNTATP